MISSTNYNQGGDAQAIKRIANAYYGGYKNMFEAHHWPERGDMIMPAVQKRVVDVYGSVRAFEDEHAPGVLMFPMEAIKSNPPNVWLTSFYGFRPEGWGYLGFSDETRRQSFLRRSKPGVLVVIYGTSRAPKEMRQKIIGVIQCSHQIGSGQQFMAPADWTRKVSDPESKEKWNYGVKAVRAWRVMPESSIAVREFAPVATKNNAWEHIGAQGEPLTKQEALNILTLQLQEVDVYGEAPIIGSVTGIAKQILAPSRAGPVSQTPYTVKEAEGPKHLYILQLQGDTDAFLGEPAQGRIIIKAGFSRSPEIRRDDHNRALPQCAFRWDVLHSGPLSGFSPYPTSDHAKAGEQAMQDVLCREAGCRSLGGEFFLASHKAIETAWAVGNKTAKEF
jgi:hypothetical protein